MFSALLVCAAVAFAGDKKCSAAARECEFQIRQMLSGQRYLGASFTDLLPGLGVKSVAAGGPAERAGVKVGDRIIAINERWTRDVTVRDFKQKMMGNVLRAGRVTLLVQRSGEFRRITVRLEPYTRAQIERIVAGHVEQSHMAQRQP